MKFDFSLVCAVRVEKTLKTRCIVPARPFCVYSWSKVLFSLRLSSLETMVVYIFG